jgi:hypothetical protein
MSSLLTLVGILIVGLLAFLLVQRIIFAVIRRVLRDEVQRRTRGREVLLQTFTANFFGRESLGPAQIRGNGALILTRTELIFILAFPRRETVIPIETITSITQPRSHLGKTAFRPLLRVQYAGPQGADTIAWAVGNPDHWQETIASVAPQIG